MSDGPFWYQTQERAMAPGVGDGWPEIIPAPHTPNARLKRMDGDPMEMQAEIERLRAQLDDTVESVTKALHEIHNYTPYDAKQFLHPLMERLGHPMADPELDEGGE